MLLLLLVVAISTSFMKLLDSHNSDNINIYKFYETFGF